MIEKLDTSGLLHTCGKKLVYKGIDNGCYFLVCPNEKCDGASYRLPIEDPRKLVSPCELITLPRFKVYNCRDCGAGITEEQALGTFKEDGRAPYISNMSIYVFKRHWGLSRKMVVPCA